MATRKNIRTNFYTEIENAVDGIIDPSRISMEYPNTTEELPRVVHGDSYRPVPMGVNTAPKEVDKSGDVVTYIYSVPMEAQFTLVVLSNTETEKEVIYEALRQHFEEFELPIRNVDIIHEDISRLEVLDAASRDDEDRDPVGRGDSLSVSLYYERLYEHENEPIDDIEQTINSEDDVTTETRTIN